LIISRFLQEKRYYFRYIILNKEKKRSDIQILISTMTQNNTAMIMASIRKYGFIYFNCCILLLFTSTTIFAQIPNPYNYQDLSHIYFAKKSESIKKTWVCPALYKNKETQKKFNEFWTSRTGFITSAIEGKNFVQENESYTYVSDILAELVKNNPKYFSSAPFLLIDRSSSVNAYAIGANTLAVNLGLLLYAESREEIALVIAHELAHNALNHAEKSMKERAELLTSEEYKKSLESVLDSKYERFSRLKKLLQEYTFDRAKHSRYHEGDADSLAIEFLKNSKIGFDARFFLRLDSTDLVYKQPLKNPIKSYFTGYNLPFQDWWIGKQTKGLSTKAYNFKSSSIEDSVKTHPECIERYQKNAAYSSSGISLTPVPRSLKDKVNKMIIWNLFDNGALTACLYRVFMEKDKGSTDPWYDFMAHNVLLALNYADKNQSRFNAINIQSKEYISKEYYELQTMLEQISRENLEQYCRAIEKESYSQKLPSDANALKAFMQKINFDGEETKKGIETAAKNYNTNFSSSMYREFTDHFKK
jgi:Peptidase family M48